jgi:hypothetical protein
MYLLIPVLRSTNISFLRNVRVLGLMQGIHILPGLLAHLHRVLGQQV